MDVTTAAASSAGQDQQALQDIATEAYLYLYPLVMMDLTRRQMTNVEAGKKVGFGPMNTFVHMRAFPPPEFRVIPWANFDTLYSPAWLDLSHGPLILSVPDTGGRFYLLPIQDMWTDAFAVPGKRTTGTGAAHFALTPAHWHGTLPAGVKRINAPTPTVWMLGRIQTNGPADYEAVRRVQDGLSITPLSDWGQPPRAVGVVAIDPDVDMSSQPVEQVNRMSGSDFFSYAAQLLQLHPPHVTDWSIVTRMQRLGLVPGESFDSENAGVAVQQALQEAPNAGLAAMRAKVPTLGKNVNGWQVSAEAMGVYGNYYLKRATLAMVGLGSNPPEDAIYPLTFVDGDGEPLHGDHEYVLRFENGNLPPVDAFWSVTLYDRDGFQVPNALNRSALGDRDALDTNPDGSLELHIQRENPGPDREANWLPTPSGPFALFLRLYQPRAQVLDGSWEPPPARRLR